MAGNTKYKNDWAKEKLDRISLTVPRGHKAELQAHAEHHGESLNALIRRAVDETMTRDIEVEEFAKTYTITVEKAPKFIELVKAVNLIESEIPGFKELYFSKQLPQVIANRITKMERNGGSHPIYS